MHSELYVALGKVCATAMQHSPAVATAVFILRHQLFSCQQSPCPHLLAAYLLSCTNTCHGAHRPSARYSSRAHSEREWWKNTGESDDSDDDLFGSNTDSGSNFY